MTLQRGQTALAQHFGEHTQADRVSTPIVGPVFVQQQQQQQHGNMTPEQEARLALARRQQQMQVCSL